MRGIAFLERGNNCGITRIRLGIGKDLLIEMNGLLSERG